jgi:hypothetical protein
MTIIRYLFAGLLICSALHRAPAADTNVYFGDGTPDWAYHRVWENSIYLILHADLSPSERDIQRRKAHNIFFEYWLLHRSSRATLPPVASFEQYFGKLVRREVLASVERDDPLGIRGAYTDGRRRKDAQILKTGTLTDEDLATWAGYQELVAAFKKFTGEPEAKKKK